MKLMTIKEHEEWKKKKQRCWDRLKKIAEEYAQKYMHPHMTIIIDQRGIEELEGVKADSFISLDELKELHETLQKHLARRKDDELHQD